MKVWLNKSRQDCFPGTIYDLNIRFIQTVHVIAVTDGKDFFTFYSNAGCFTERFVHRQNVCVDKHDSAGRGINLPVFTRDIPYLRGGHRVPVSQFSHHRKGRGTTGAGFFRMNGARCQIMEIRGDLNTVSFFKHAISL